MLLESELVEGLKVGPLVAFGGAVGRGDAYAFGAGYGCDGAYLASVEVGGVAVILIGGIHYACEAEDVGLDGLGVAGFVEFGVEPSATGGVEEVVHAVD